ncbi:MAG: LCP family protein [Actinomycetota bacterium]|nr:LCP family protein [Actinomycetota bacterium]
MASDVQQNKPRFFGRVLTAPNLLSVAIGLIIFWILAGQWRSVLGTVAAAVAGSVITALVWMLWMRLSRGPDIAKVVDEPVLAYVPATPGGPTPTLGEPDSAAAQIYLEAVSALETATNGQVIMVSSVSPGLGATTVAMNLATAATRMGRRVVLVDADPSGGLSEFGQSESTPGWTDLASGTASLEQASRLWKIDDVNSLPVIPVGSDIDDRGAVLGGMALAEVVDELTEHADLLVVNSAPVNWDASLQQVATHADGTILVVTPEADARTLGEIGERLREIGAPVIGYVVNKADSLMDRRPRWRRSLKRMLSTFLILLVVYSGWNAYSAWNAWQNVERHSFDEIALDELAVVPPPAHTGETLTAEAATAVTAVPSETGTYDTYMVVGSDIGDFRADVIILVMLPSDGSDPIMVSLPRDLYLPNRCTQTYTRLNANFNGCGDEINGATLLSGAVEDFTGVDVDHFALFTFDGFEEIIDEVGGVEICVAYAVRDRKAELNLEAGCTNATGAQALSWVRSRSTLEYVNGVWQTMANVSDLTRNERQQDVILTMLDKVGEFDSPQELAGAVRSVSNAFTLDDQLGLSDVINLAWELRGLKAESIIRINLPVEHYETSAGAQVLVATTPFHELLEEYFAAPASELPE